jgi:hypothetical protein
MELIQTCSQQVATTINGLPPWVRPSGCEFQFAIKINGEYGAVLAKVGAEAQFQVTLKWESKDEQKQPGSTGGAGTSA